MIIQNGCLFGKKLIKANSADIWTRILTVFQKNPRLSVNEVVGRNEVNDVSAFRGGREKLKRLSDNRRQPLRNEMEAD